MGENTAISWTDHTFNPWHGCTKVSPACANCYAERDSRRYGFDIWGDDKQRRMIGPNTWKEPIRWNAKAAKAGVRRRVFCASMADVFEAREDLVHERARLWEMVRNTPWLDWLMLTKRPENIRGMLPPDWGDQGFENVWLGTTVESEPYAWRVHELLLVPAPVHFASFEPALGGVDWSPLVGHGRLDWLIAGGESGMLARASHPSWFARGRDACIANGAMFHFKQWGEWVPPDEYLADPADEPPRQAWIREDGTRYTTRVAGSVLMVRPGRAAAGRSLAGHMWDQVPLSVDL